MDKRIRKFLLSPSILVLMAVLTTQCTTTDPESLTISTEPIPVRVGSTTSEMSSMTLIAYEEGYFADEGLDVDMTIHSYGRLNLDAVIQDELDIGGTMTTPFVFEAAQSDDIRIIASVYTRVNLIDGIGRIDRGITMDPHSLIGKKVATILGTAAHYNLDAWLLNHGMTLAQLDIVDMPILEGITALENGEVDAVYYGFPFTTLAYNSLGDNAIDFTDEKTIRNSLVYVAKADFIEENPEAIEAFLSALFRAQNTYSTTPDVALSAYSKFQSDNAILIADIYYDLDYQITLDQPLLTELEYQTIWFQEKGYLEQSPIPYYQDLIYLDAMLKVKPSAVSIIVE